MEILFLPFLACAALTLIHATLGHHVLLRGIIFVDLALAQVASLGAVAAFFLGFTFHGVPSYLISLGSAILGAALFSFLRRTKHPVQQEALIGVVYVASASVTILLLNFAPMEAGRIKEMLVGNILFIQGKDVLGISILYAAIGIFHWTFRKKLLLVSGRPLAAKRAGINVRLWDFLFYVSFAIVVTSSVAVAGVLLVFAFLIIPILAGSLFAKRVGPRLLFGWGLGMAGSAIGLFLSYQGDLPTGAAIVCALALVLILSYPLRLLYSRFSLKKSDE